LDGCRSCKSEAVGSNPTVGSMGVVFICVGVMVVLIATIPFWHKWLP
jgi:hypothetical protein